MLKFATALALLLVSIFPTAFARAEQLRIAVAPRGAVDRLIDAPVRISLTGVIDADSPRRLESALSKIREPWIAVYLDSPGGDLSAGLRIGRILRKRDATVTVGKLTDSYQPAPAGCYSACAFAFLGGSYRYVPEGSEFGVHRASSLTPRPSDLALGQIIAAKIGAYIREMGVDSELLDLTVKAGADSIYRLSKSELERLRVTNNGRKAPVWSIEVIAGGTYLRGVQESLYGTGKMSIICAGQQIFMMSSYTAAGKAQDIANGGWAHSISIGRDLLPLPDPSRVSASGEFLNSQFELTPKVVRQMIGSDSVGHTMQLDRSAQTFVGYRISVDSASRERFDTYLGNCIR